AQPDLAAAGPETKYRPGFGAGKGQGLEVEAFSVGSLAACRPRDRRICERKDSDRLAAVRRSVRAQLGQGPQRRRVRNRVELKKAFTRASGRKRLKRQRIQRSVRNDDEAADLARQMLEPRLRHVGRESPGKRRPLISLVLRDEPDIVFDSFFELG